MKKLLLHSTLLISLSALIACQEKEPPAKPARPSTNFPSNPFGGGGGGGGGGPFQNYCSSEFVRDYNAHVTLANSFALAVKAKDNSTALSTSAKLHDNCQTFTKAYSKYHSCKAQDATSRLETWISMTSVVDKCQSVASLLKESSSGQTRVFFSKEESIQGKSRIPRRALPDDDLRASTLTNGGLELLILDGARLEESSEESIYLTEKGKVGLIGFQEVIGTGGCKVVKNRPTQAVDWYTQKSIRMVYSEYLGNPKKGDYVQSFSFVSAPSENMLVICSLNSFSPMTLGDLRRALSSVAEIRVY
jgi:hypothetical protein